MISNSPHHSFGPYKSIPVVLALWIGITLLSAVAGDESQTTSLPPSAPLADGSASSIPFSQLGAKATAESNGEGTGVRISPEGACLHTDFQKLAGRITREGLWLESTAKGGGGLRLTARAIGRIDCFRHDLPKTGSVTVGEKTVTFSRPGLTEEYSVSVDGLRQDFIVTERPAGMGLLRVELALSGARAETAADGAKMTFDDSGRELIYNRLHVIDAAGRTLAATLKTLAADRLVVSVNDKDAAYPVRIDPTFSDADWASLNPGMPGANGIVSAITVDGSGNVYIGGDFTAVGTVTASRVAMWNGSVWSPLGSGLNGSATALAIKGSEVYVGGQFTTAGGVAVSNIAVWNGSAWSSSGLGTSGEVSTLAVIGNDVFAAGLFTTAGGVTVNNIAKWDGLAWSPLGSGTNSRINAVAASGSDLYAAGTFTTAGGTAAKGIAKWNGNAWAVLDDGIGNIGTIYTLATDGTDLYIGGNFSFYTDKHLTPFPDPSTHFDVARNVAKWNGSGWSILGTGTNGIVNRLAVGGGIVYASGSFTLAGGSAARNIAQWSGSTWSALGAGLESTAWALAVSGDKVYAGGPFGLAGGVTAPFIAKWEDAAWSAFGSGMDGVVMATTVSGTDLYIGGNFTTIDGVSANRIAKWNGSAWSSLGSGMNHDVHALQVIGTDLYAGGRFTTAGGVTANRLAKWDGTQWTPLGTGANSNIGTLAAMDGDLYTAGSFPTLSGTTYYTVAKWDGTHWTALGSGMDNEVSALATSGSVLYAAGYFDFAGGVLARKIAKWDGSVWSPVGSGMNSLVYALAVSGTDLYAGGQFSTAGGVPANCIAKWDGSEWSALGTGMTGAHATFVLALAMNGTALYAGGEFYLAGGVPGTRNIAEWTGSEWLAIGSGVNGRVSALSISDSSRLFIGGSFTLAGSTVSPHIVQADNLLATPLFEVRDGTVLLEDGSASPVNFGPTPLGKVSSKTFMITNNGVEELTLAPISIEGVNAADFVVGKPVKGTLSTGESTTFTVAFSPAAVGMKTAAIRLVGIGPGDIPFDIALAGTASPAIPPARTEPEIVVKQPVRSSLVDGSSKMSFGTTKVNKLGATRTFTIKNTGTATLTGISVSKKGDHKKDFTLTAPVKTSLAPGASVTFKVRFKPTARKTRNASIHIRSNDADENPFDIKLTGFGAAR
ncbi:MAG: choice-of-anchor D domain-containing protein [Verrucomicrobiota bacterium]